MITAGVEIPFALKQKQQDGWLIVFPEQRVPENQLEDSFIEEEVGLATLDFAFAHRLNVCVADMKPGSYGRLWKFRNKQRICTHLRIFGDFKVIFD